nr:hypothetical protein [Tanacetum cinerariifolium]
HGSSSGDGDTDGSDGVEGDLDLLRDEDGKSDGGEDDNGKSDGSEDYDGKSDGGEDDDDKSDGGISFLSRWAKAGLVDPRLMTHRQNPVGSQTKPICDPIMVEVRELREFWVPDKLEIIELRSLAKYAESRLEQSHDRQTGCRARTQMADMTEHDIKTLHARAEAAEQQAETLQYMITADFDTFDSPFMVRIEELGHR